MKPYEQFEHTGDIGIKIYGNSPEQLFENAARALFDLMTDLKKVLPRHQRIVEVTASEREELLVNWLSELNYIFQTEYFLCARFKITELSETCLKAIVQGEPRNPEQHQIEVEIKAVTFHLLKIEATDDGWWGQVIFDI